MGELRFVHMADLHLGYRQYNLTERLKDFGKAALHATEKALEYEPDFVLVAGDIFHDSRPYPGAIRQALQIFTKFRDAGIPVYAIRGNHDASYARSERLGGDALHLLEDVGLITYIRDKVVTFEKKGKPKACICGVGYYGRNTEQKLTEVLKQNKALLEEKGVLKILMAHVFIEGMVPQYDISAYILTQENFDYIALGHYHGYFRDDNARLYAPGAIEHTSVSEWDDPDRGVNLVTATPQIKAKSWTVDVQRLTVPTRPKKAFEINLGVIEAHEVEPQAREVVKQHDEPGAILRGVLRGRLRGDTFAFINTSNIGTAATQALLCNITNELETTTLSIKEEATFEEVIEEVLRKQLGIKKTAVKTWKLLVTDMMEILKENQPDTVSKALERLDKFTTPKKKRSKKPKRTHAQEVEQ